MWTNEQTAALIASIEEDALKLCRNEGDCVPNQFYYEWTKEKSVFDLPRDWNAIAAKLGKTGKNKHKKFVFVDQNYSH